MENTTSGPNSSGFKRFQIGPYIKEVAISKHITPRELANRTGIDKHNIYRIFKAKQMAVKNLLKFSEALEENLLEKYYPDVPGKEHPLQAEVIHLRSENANLKKQLAVLQNASEENKILKAQLEVLREVVRAK